MKIVEYQPTIPDNVMRKIIKDLGSGNYEVKNVEEKVEMDSCFIYKPVMTPDDFLHQKEKTTIVDLKLDCGLYIKVEGTERCY